MRLFLTIEAQNATESGLSNLLKEINIELDFVTSKDRGLETVDNYGTEFKEIAIIPTCASEEYLKILGWKERKQIWRKKQEADIRLHMDYDRFINETEENKRLMFIHIIIKSIEVVIERANGDFNGQQLIDDILTKLKVKRGQLEKYGI